jgi:hypothetical protein
MAHVNVAPPMSVVMSAQSLRAPPLLPAADLKHRLCSAHNGVLCLHAAPLSTLHHAGPALHPTAPALCCHMCAMPCVRDAAGMLCHSYRCERCCAAQEAAAGANATCVPLATAQYFFLLNNFEQAPNSTRRRALLADSSATGPQRGLPQIWAGSTARTAGGGSSSRTGRRRLISGGAASLHGMLLLGQPGGQFWSLTRHTALLGPCRGAQTHVAHTLQGGAATQARVALTA